MATTAPTTLLAALSCKDNIHLIVGNNPLAATRCNQSLTAGAQPILVSDSVPDPLVSLMDEGAIRWEKEFEEGMLFRLGRDEVDGIVDAVFLTCPVDAKLADMVGTCRRYRIPVNVVDRPDLCSFTLLSVYRDGPLQVGVTTNGNGCGLAVRVRRFIAAELPKGLGQAVERLGRWRRRVIVDADHGHGDDDDDDDDDEKRRVRLAAITEDATLETLLSSSSSPTTTTTTTVTTLNHHHPPTPPGRLILAGSGPGHPSLLTLATLDAMQKADTILADKLIPSSILRLIPRRTPVEIARKFPGHADEAQAELLASALEAVREGKTVLRLKQGDPYVYGRGGEELAWFAQRGLAHRVVVLPGLSSALAAPLLANVPVTQRDVAHQLLICTATGKKGRAAKAPEFVAGRTVVFLMALHRIEDLVRELTTTTTTTKTTHEASSDDDEEEEEEEEEEGGGGGEEDGKSTSKSNCPPTRTRTLWPPSTPCTIIERASCADQRIIRTTLQHVPAAVRDQGSRPPGLVVLGRACEALCTPRDPRRPWVVDDGFRQLDDFDGLNAFFRLQQQQQQQQQQ
ncbi:hypothetical protein XA68_17880 [Ophiocordyceps unilateralis]|uniref:precorrin-2 dehydrogenase n=1 Tax=Ophiocordyceps unilateralis TaxID=268505 RepID=A0A2A9PK97_OPHUN|nr:hypothetical protein XA68_17880 [Ophiocordyceps unilateralis]